MEWLFGSSSSFDTAKSIKCFNRELIGKCGSCTYMNIRNYTSSFFGGYKYKCEKRGGYYPWDDRSCYYIDEIDPGVIDCAELYKKFTGRTFSYVSSMIGIVLGLNLDEKPFANIKLLKEISSNDLEKQEQINLYDVYGMQVATNLYFDPNQVNVCEALMPVLNNVSDLVDSKNYDEAFNMYFEMVKQLYIRYSHSLVNASGFDYQNNIFEQERLKKENQKVLTK